MLHHLSLAVTDVQRAARFYDATLGALEYVRAWSFETAIGYGRSEGKDKFAIKRCESELPSPPAQFHLAFSAPDRDSVKAFHAGGLDNGGRDNGGPGLRTEYGPDYYAAYVFDPDGYNIEAVFK